MNNLLIGAEDMTHEEIRLLLQRQKAFFRSGQTLPVAFRLEQLKKLYAAVKKYEADILSALHSDLGKSGYEGFMCETGLALTEISYMIKHARKFSRKKRVATPLAQFASSSFKQPVPYGNTLIMSPWNYPFLLTIDPLADAIAAGNTAIVKPSAYSPATSAVIEKIIGECFPEEYVAVVTGGRKENAGLLKEKFDLIFLDPPYGSGLLEKAMELIATIDIVSENGIIVCENGSNSGWPVVAEPYRMQKEYRYGKIRTALYRRNAE